MKHAYLIKTHEYTHVLETLVKMIDDERNDIYIHIDRKVKQSYADRISAQVMKSQLYFVRRIKEYWGNVSQVKAEYLLFQSAEEKGPYAYYHLISGSDLPIKTQDDIHVFFDSHLGYEFISFAENGMKERALFRWPFSRHLRGLCSNSRWIYRKVNRLQGKITRCCIEAQKKIGMKNNAFLEYKKGTNWVSLTQQAVELLLECKEKVLRGFRYANCPDEHYKQTLLYDLLKRGSALRFYKYHDEYGAGNGSMDETDECILDAMRYIDWRRSLNLTMKDWDRIKASDAMFCRKVVDDTLADKIYEQFGPK